MIDVVVFISLITMSMALVLCAYRVLKGPTVADRVVALDAVSSVVMGLLVLGSLRLRETKYLDYAIVLAVLSFVSTVAYARYIERGVIIDHDTE